MTSNRANCRATLLTILWQSGPQYAEQMQAVVIGGLIAITLVLLTCAAMAGLFDVDIVFALTFLLLVATAALLPTFES